MGRKMCTGLAVGVPDRESMGVEMKRLAVLTLLAAMLPACGSEEDRGARNASDLHFITFGPGVTGLVSKVKRPNLSVCLSGVAEGDRKVWTEAIQSSVLKWVTPLRALTSAQLATSVSVVRAGEPCEADVVARPGTHANTLIGSRPTVNMDVSGYFASYNVLLHEFGHAFALSDTYQNGQSGNCRAGQPQAVMCNTSFTDLQKDDVAGLAKIFKQSFPGDKPGATPPNDPNVDFTKLKFATALSAEGSEGTHQIALGLSGIEQRDAVAAICFGNESECRNSESGWRDLVRLERRGDVTIFQDQTGTTMQNQLVFTMRYKNATGAAYGSFRIGGLVP